MKKSHKRFIALFTVLLFSLALFGCGDASEEEEETENVSGDTDAYTVYYMNDDWTDFVEESINIDQLESTENIIDKLMNALITEGEAAECNIPVAEGLSYQRYSYDGNGTVTLMFNEDYDTVESYRALLTKMAFTKTLCQISDVNKVEFQMTDLIGKREVDISDYDEDSFSSIEDDFMEPEVIITIYVPDTDGNALVKTEMEIDPFLYTTPEEQIIDTLINSTGWNSSVSDDIGIIDVYINDSVCYVNFENVENKNAEFFNNEIYIYSIVDSLTTLENVSSVAFTVDGSRNVSYGDIIDFTKNYTANYSYCE